jgi:hypothetical protein
MDLSGQLDAPAALLPVHRIKFKARSYYTISYVVRTIHHWADIDTIAL